MRPCMLPCWPFFLALATGCTHYAYYQSPFHTNTSGYKTIPMQMDSLRSALYVDGLFTTGAANDDNRDKIWGGIVSVYRSHTWKNVQGYYGLNGALGGYRVATYSEDPGYTSNHVNAALINSMAGTKTWGGLGINGGINLSIPFRFSEWRILGLEASWQREFGQYLRFRRNIPKTDADVVDHSRNYITLALGSDMVWNIRNGQVGYKVAGVFSARSIKGYYDSEFEVSRNPGYFSQTLHLTIKKVTAYTQLNTGNYAMSWQLGMSHRLGR